LKGASHYLKLDADQGYASVQLNYGFCLSEGEPVSKDLKGGTHYFKLAADQDLAVAQYNYGRCLYKGEGVRTDFRGAIHYFKLAADPNTSHCSNGTTCCQDRSRVQPYHIKSLEIEVRAKGQYRWSISLLNRYSGNRDVVAAIPYFKLFAGIRFEICPWNDRREWHRNIGRF
jgi:hypothetical protein